MGVWQSISDKKLSIKVMSALVVFLLLAVFSIGLTLYWSWQLQGSAAAINEAGRLRMHSYRLALHLHLAQSPGQTDKDKQNAWTQVLLEKKAINNIFTLLKAGDPQRPLFLPPAQKIETQLQALEQSWHDQFLLMPTQALNQPVSVDIDPFVGKVNQFVKTIEEDSERRTFWLRTSQLTLLSLAMLSTAIMVYMLFVLIIQPVERLQSAMKKMQQQDLSARVPVESQDEFGELSVGFNQMAQELQMLYTHLEQRVQQKTAELSKQNHELALLYDCAAFLQEPQSIEDLCAGFLQRIQSFFNAEAGSVRIFDEQKTQLHMLAYRGLTDSMMQMMHCVKLEDCVCAQAVYQKSAVIHQLGHMVSPHLLACQSQGFKTVSAFHIHVYEDYLGLFNLYFSESRSFSLHEKTMLDTLGQLLGVAIQNIRLATQARELARLEERNLVAQGLHDSIAQGLTFLNIQMQLLEESLLYQRMDQVADVVPALQAGIQEIYDDVRELLLNFRSRLPDAGLYQAIAVVVDKFQQQTGIAIEFECVGQGVPLSREQQLQILFIVQEALSNIRKHADADSVTIRIEDGRNFELSITDDGEGFDMEELAQQSESHIGLHIMQERSTSINAQLTVRSVQGQGTCVQLCLSEEHRHAA